MRVSMSGWKGSILCFFMLTFPRFLFANIHTKQSIMTPLSKNDYYKCELALVKHTICRVKHLRSSNISSSQPKLQDTLQNIYSGIEEITQSYSSGVWDRQKLCTSGSYGVYGFPIPLNYPVQKMIKFEEPFDEPPVVTYGITKVDASRTDYLWFLVSIEHVTKTGFTIVFNRYRDTVLYGLDITWMACPR